MFDFSIVLFYGTRSRPAGRHVMGPLGFIFGAAMVLSGVRAAAFLRHLDPEMPGDPIGTGDTKHAPSPK